MSLLQLYLNRALDVGANMTDVSHTIVTVLLSCLIAYCQRAPLALFGLVRVNETTFAITRPDYFSLVERLVLSPNAEHAAAGATILSKFITHFLSTEIVYAVFTLNNLMLMITCASLECKHQ